MSLFSDKYRSEKLNPEFIKHLKIARKVTLVRIITHIAYWIWIGYETYKDFNGLLRDNPDSPLDPQLHRLMFISHWISSIAIYYTVGYLVLPSLIKALVYGQATRQILWRRLLFLGCSIVLIFGFYNIFDYFLFFTAISNFSPVPNFIVRNAKFVVDLGPVGYLNSQRTQSFIWAFNFSYLLLPSQLRLLRWMTYWGVDNLIKQEQNQNLIKKQHKHLKSQLSPHFLFNALGNVYALIHRNNPKAAQLLRQIIDLLKHMLYRTEADYVQLQEELNFIKNFVDVERSRIDRGAERIHLKQSGKVGDQLVPPLLLLTFIENAFKHGIRKSWEDGWIHIELNVIDKEHLPAWLHMQVRNSISADPYVSPELPNDQDTDKGVGLINAQQRLNLLYGKENYSLVIEEQPSLYQVNLKIPLNKTI